jgi:hypothetical protein
VTNATATAQSEATTVARTVDATVAATSQATATVANAQLTPAAATPTTGTGIAATSVPSPSAAVGAVCATQPVRGFGLLYTTNASVASRLGCAVDSEVGSPSSTQPFESGLMFWIAKQVYVLRNSNSWSVFVDNYQNGQPLPTPTVVAPAGRFAPLGEFGLVWEQQPDVRSQLGWATGPILAGNTGAQERFAHGTMVWTPTKTIYVLYSDNTWQSFPDNFQG